MSDAIRCTTCGQVWAALDLAPIYDYWGRVRPGGVVPLGQCVITGQNVSQNHR
jgi:hypothetical protein